MIMMMLMMMLMPGRWGGSIGAGRRQGHGCVCMTFHDRDISQYLITHSFAAMSSVFCGRSSDFSSSAFVIRISLVAAIFFSAVIFHGKIWIPQGLSCGPKMELQEARTAQRDLGGSTATLIGCYICNDPPCHQPPKAVWWQEVLDKAGAKANRTSSCTLTPAHGLTASSVHGDGLRPSLEISRALRRRME